MPPVRHLEVPLSAVSALIQSAPIDAMLARWVPEPEERAFVVRCMLEAGPVHHRGANYVILLLLAQLLERVSPATVKPSGEELALIPMRLPGHHGSSRDLRSYPLRLAIAPLRHLAADDERRLGAMVDCLTDGPPQHALANAAIVNALGLLLEQLNTQSS